MLDTSNKIKKASLILVCDIEELVQQTPADKAFKQCNPSDERNQRVHS